MSKFIDPTNIEHTYYNYLKIGLEYGEMKYSINVPLLKILPRQLFIITLSKLLYIVMYLETILTF